MLTDLYKGLLMIRREIKILTEVLRGGTGGFKTGLTPACL